MLALQCIAILQAPKLQIDSFKHVLFFWTFSTDILKELSTDLESCEDVYVAKDEGPAAFYEVFSDTDDDDEKADRVCLTLRNLTVIPSSLGHLVSSDRALYFSESKVVRSCTFVRPISPSCWRQKIGTINIHN